MQPADAAGGRAAFFVSDPPWKEGEDEVEAEAEAEVAGGPVLRSGEAGCGGSSGSSSSTRGVCGGGPEAGGGPPPPAERLILGPASAEEPALSPEGLLLSLASEPYETVFADPHAPWSGDEAAQDGACFVRNLDTGEVRHLGQDSLTVSFLQGEQADPMRLAGRRTAPWGSWWSEKHRKDEQLRRAAESGDMDVLHRLLAYPIDGSPPVEVNSRGLHDRTALHIAASAGNLDFIETLLEARASMGAQTDTGLTALHLASRQGHSKVVSSLLQAGAEVLYEDTGLSLAIHFAAAKGHAEIVALLLDHGGAQQMHVRNHLGQRPAEASTDIQTAMVFRQFEALLAQGSEKSSGSSGESDEYAGRTPLAKDGVLLRNARADVVHRLLLATRRPPEARSRSSGTATAARSASAGRELCLSPMSSAAGQSTPKVRAPFARVRSGNENLEPVGPNSFELVKLLGRGSFGEVFQVRHKQTDKVFAMKVLQKSKILSSNLLRYAMTERNILAYVRHPYIVYLHYAFQTQSHLVLVLEFCPNGNLQHLICREKRLHEQLARLYTAEILLALCHLHERQTVFRDLKPDNVVIDAAGHAMLTDFGLSKEGVAGQRGTKSFCGSVAFLAPEILLRKGHGHTVDIYNLGVLLFDMLTGLPPFYHPDRETLFANIKHARLQVPQYVPRVAKSLIETLMEREPSRRLGAGRTSEVKEHPFFAGLDFAALMRREVHASTPTMLPALASWRGERPASPLCRGAPESPFGRADRAAGWRARYYSRGRDSDTSSDGNGSVSGWEFAAVPQLLPQREAVKRSEGQC